MCVCVEYLATKHHYLLIHSLPTLTFTGKYWREGSCPETSPDKRNRGVSETAVPIGLSLEHFSTCPEFDYAGVRMSVCGMFAHVCALLMFVVDGYICVYVYVGVNVCTYACASFSL